MTLQPSLDLQVILNSQAQRLLVEHSNRINVRCDRMFAGLFIVQWIAGIACALIVTPRTWIGGTPFVHIHVSMSVILGAVIISLPLYLTLSYPGTAVTRHTIAIAQCLYSALLIHLSGGRIETHFHIFGSLALLAFYRDWRVLVTATLVVAADHLFRGLYWSQSVFGVAYASHWRWVEHAGWVLFEDVFLIMSCVQGRREMAEIAWRQADTVEQGNRRSAKLTMALSDQYDLLGVMDSSVLLFTTGPDYSITSVNDRFCEISGFTCEELVGKNLSVLGRGTKTAAVHSQRELLVHAGKSWHGEVCKRAKDGHEFWLDMTMKGILGTDGQIQKIVAVSSDVTNRKAAEQHLLESQKLESIGQLAAGIAHEINTPAQYVGDNIRFIQGQIDKLMSVVGEYSAQLDPTAPARSWQERSAEINRLMKDLDFDFLKEEVPLAMTQSLEGLDRVTAIVRAMKDFSHPGSTVKEPADLNRSILSTVEVCRNRWKYVADLELNLAPDLPAVPCFIAEFNQVILNLVVNAADAISEVTGRDGSRKGKININTQVQNDSVEIRVQDDGPGIPEKATQRIFEPFFTTKPVGQGTGQGLSLSRNIIVQKHGGELSFQTTIGAGTTFIIRLPLTDKSIKRKQAA